MPVTIDHDLMQRAQGGIEELRAAGLWEESSYRLSHPLMADRPCSRPARGRESLRQRPPQSID